MTEQTSQGPPRTLRRSDNRVVGGVCAGIADYCGIDPVIVRILTVVGALFAPPVVLAYLLAWVLLPPSWQSGVRDRSTGTVVALVVGVVLLVPVLLAATAATSHTLAFGQFETGWLLGPPVFVLLLVLLAAGWRRGRYDGPPPPPPPPGPIEPPPPGVPAWWAEPQPDRPWPARREPATLSWLTTSAALIAAGACVSANLLGLTSLNAAAVLALALGVVGAGLVVGAWVGSPRGLVPLAVLLALATGVASLAVDFSGGTRYVRPNAAELKSSYRLGIGQLTLDLRDLEFPPAHPVRVHVTAGRIVVRVPAHLHVRATGHAGNGDVVVFDRAAAGRDVHVMGEQPGRGQEADLSSPALELDLSVRFGAVEVHQ